MPVHPLALIQAFPRSRCALVECHPIPLAHVLPQAAQPDPIELAASFGRWWLDGRNAQVALSCHAAAFLGAEPGVVLDLQQCLKQVLDEDWPVVTQALQQDFQARQMCDCEFRVIQPGIGLRWLRMQSLAGASVQSMDGVLTGLLVDITAAKHAQMRERFSFETTQVLVGAHTLAEAVTKVIELVCQNMGWEWGAYWALEPDALGGHHFRCCYHWNNHDLALASFTDDSCSVRMNPNEGMIGHVWTMGTPTWVEGLPDDHSFVRRHSAREGGLQSGYAFPVTYVTNDGRRHSPGVLEFFSTLPRQRNALLPDLSAAIGALIAQTLQRLEQQAHIRRLAEIDDLTGLANRNCFHQALDKACREASHTGTQFGVLFVDLDRFKQINDAFGHEAGNVVLREFAQRLKKLAPEGCIIGRLGGDEYAILMAASSTHDLLNALAEGVLLSASMPFVFGHNELVVSASVGISIFPHNGCTGPELLRSADSAMYASKKNGRNALSFFAGPALPQSALVQQMSMESQLRRALRFNEFVLLYQPVSDCLGGELVAVEALIRWRRPGGEWAQPDAFLKVAEKSRLIVQIGHWVARQACQDLARLQRSGLAGLQMNINLTAQEFIHADLPDALARLAADAGIFTRHLGLELSEAMVMKQPDRAIPVMRALRQQGFQLALDDFGMGRCSLSHLNQLPITHLKIDRSFIQGLPRARGEAAIVRTMLDLGRLLKIQVVAKGVETDAQLGFLRQFGCSLVQGYLLAQPMTLEQLLRQFAPAPAQESR